MSEIDSNRPLPPIIASGDLHDEYDGLVSEVTIGKLSDPQSQPYDPEPGRERIRGLLALTLIGAFLTGCIGFSICVIVGRLDLATAKELASVFLTPLFGLASAAVGFYYATGGRS